MEDSFINPKKRPIKPLSGMNIPNLEKWEIRRKKAVKTVTRLVIRRGAKEEEWELPMRNHKVEDIGHRRWHNRRARREKNEKANLG